MNLPCGKDDVEKREIVVMYQPKILRNLREICEEMGVGAKTVKAWVKKGAPIAVEGVGGKTRYSTELARAFSK